MPISDSFILRKIKRLHRRDSESNIGASPPPILPRKDSLSQRSSDGESEKWFFHKTLGWQSPKKEVEKEEKPFLTDVVENYVIHKYFDADYITHKIPIEKDFDKVAFTTSLYQPGLLDPMSWSTPSGSTEVETILQNRKTSNQMIESDLWSSTITDQFNSEPRTPSLPDKMVYKSQEIPSKKAASEDGRISPVQQYIESLCDFNELFNDLNKKIKDASRSATLPSKHKGLLDIALENTESAAKKALHHTQSAQDNYLHPGSFMQKQSASPIPESGRKTPLILKSTNWRCKSAKVVDITQEWIISKDEESFSAQAYFIPMKDLSPAPPHGFAPVPEDYRRGRGDPWRRLRHSSPIKKQITRDDYNLLKNTVMEVQRDLDQAREKYRRDMNEDALEIERAILEMSEQLARQGPVSKAQAEASEELLKTRLAEMILNLPTHTEPHMVQNPAENYDILKEPINLLRERLSNLEQTLVVDEELSIKEELRQIAKSPSITPAQQKKQKILRRRSENLARMTPLIHVVKNKLTTLEDVVDDNDEKTAARRSGKSTPVSDRRILHDLLWRINSEINKIHELCKTSKQMESLNTVIDVLSKVCVHLDTILDTLRQWQSDNEKTRAAQENKAANKEYLQSLKALESLQAALENAKTTSDQVTVNVDFKKEEEHEMTNTFVMFTSGSEKPTIGTSVSLNFTKKEEELFADFIHKLPKLENASQVATATAYIQFSPVAQRRLMFNQQNQSSIPEVSNPPQTAIVEVPYIHLTGPACEPSSSDANMEVSIHLKRRGDHQKASTLLPIGRQNRHLSQFTTDDRNPVQMICEESDAGTDTDTTSALFRGSARTFLPNPIEEESSDVISFTSEDSPLPTKKFTAQWKAFPDGSRISAKDTPPFMVIKKDPKEPDFVSDEEFVEVTNVRNSWNENFDLSKKKRNYKVNALLYPEQKATTSVTFLKDHVDVDVERISEKGRDSVLMLEEAFAQKAINVKEADPYFDKESTPKLSELEHDNMSLLTTTTNKTMADISVSVNAKSVSDKVFVRLEEVPWGEVAMTVGQDDKTTFDEISENKSSMIFNVMVNDNQSQGDGLSHRSSQKSLTTASQPSLNIPTYVIKHSSTASITCELNNHVNKETGIEWYKGKEPIPKIKGKFDRISHDLLEVLVINKIEYDDSELYSIKVNGELYPVAYLIVEESASGQASTLSPNSLPPPESKFVSPSQTMFVMEGQKTTISCQMKEAYLPVTWYRDQELLEENYRIHFRSTDNGWYHVIIDEAEVTDQGTYYAYFEDSSIYITLVVEEKIDEKEVVVSGPETDDEELNDYLVPPGSTATIACELESTDYLRDLIWHRDNRPIKINSEKLEHVINGNKHYLIIHNAQPEDSGVYSVKINDTQFKVAQITITEGQPVLSGSKLKRISNNSLQSFKS